MPPNNVEPEQNEVQHCFVVLADMGGMVPGGGQNPGGQNLAGMQPSGMGALPEGIPGLGSGVGPFSQMQDMSPFVFGTFLHPPQDMGALGSTGPAQTGPGVLPAGLAPSSIFSSFNMSQMPSLMFRMAPPATAAAAATASTAAASTPASNRRDAAPAAEGQRSRLRQRLQQETVSYPPGRNPPWSQNDRRMFAALHTQRPPAAGGMVTPTSTPGFGPSGQPLLSAMQPAGGQPTGAPVGGVEGPAPPAGPGAGPGVGPGAGAGPVPHALDQILQRAFSHISAEAFITDFVRQAIEANRYRGNPPASKFAIEHLKELTTPEESLEACTVCQDVVEKGAVTLNMPCGHCFHKECLMPWLSEHNTCPVCRCEVESHCARYNQQNFDKLKGRMCEETITRHKNGDPPSPEQPRMAVHAQGRWLARPPDGQPETPLVAGPAGARSLRMTLRMPVGALSALVSRMSGANPDDVLQSGAAVPAPAPATSSAAIPRAASTGMPNTVPVPVARSHSRVRPVSSGRTGPMSSLAEHMGVVPPPVPLRRHVQQPAASSTTAVSNTADAGAEAEKVAAVSDCGNANADDMMVWDTTPRRQAVRSRRRTLDDSNEGAMIDTTPDSTSGSGRKRAKRDVAASEIQQGASTGDLQELRVAGAGAARTADSAPISSRTRKRH